MNVDRLRVPNNDRLSLTAAAWDVLFLGEAISFSEAFEEGFGTGKKF